MTRTRAVAPASLIVHVGIIECMSRLAKSRFRAVAVAHELFFPCISTAGAPVLRMPKGKPPSLRVRFLQAQGIRDLVFRVVRCMGGPTMCLSGALLWHPPGQ